LTRIGLSTFEIPGVEFAFKQGLSAGVSPSAGTASPVSKIFLMGMDVPAAGPSLHVVPDEFVRGAGTKTLYLPWSSTYRNGFSRVMGLVSSVVYGGGS